MHALLSLKDLSSVSGIENPDDKDCKAIWRMLFKLFIPHRSFRSVKNMVLFVYFRQIIIATVSSSKEFSNKKAKFDPLVQHGKFAYAKQKRIVTQHSKITIGNRGFVWTIYLWCGWFCSPAVKMTDIRVPSERARSVCLLLPSLCL